MSHREQADWNSPAIQADTFTRLIELLNERYPGKVKRERCEDDDCQIRTGANHRPYFEAHAMSDTTTVGDDFPRQQARVRKLLHRYLDIGPAGLFGATMIRLALARADKAAISGDIVEVLRSYAELKGFKE